MSEQLTGYLLTQTNVIAAVESGTTPLPEAVSLITAGISPFFNGGLRTMKFGGSIWYLRRTVGGVKTPACSDSACATVGARFRTGLAAAF
jgi:hypothetical protein